MTLYRQISLAIVLLLFAGFLGTVIISTDNLRSLLLKQQASHAQDTATSLGLSLSAPLASRDMSIVSAMVDAVFDRGYYRTIEITTLEGAPLLSRTGNLDDSNVPAWFIKLVDFESPVGEALIMSGWQQAGRVQITSNPGYAYRELWANTLETFQLFLVLAAVIIATALLAVTLLLRPLRRIEDQADAICNASYVLQRNIPHTRELRRVVTAMNRMSEKIGTIFAEQSALTNSLREQAFKDPVTGLGNRRYFDRQLSTLLESSEEASMGSLLLLELRGLADINEMAGFAAGDKLLLRTAALISQGIDNLDNCFAARISGACFGIVAVGLNSDAAEVLAQQLCDDLQQLHVDVPTSHEHIGNIGIAQWRQRDTAHNLLASADSALRTASTGNRNHWVRYTPAELPGIPVPGSRELRNIVRHAIETGSFQLCTQPVINLAANSRILPHLEVLLRIPDASGNPMTASMFMPVAERMGLATDIDQLAIGKLLNHMQTGSNRDVLYAINLSSCSVHNPVFIQWLCSTLQAAPACAARLLIEFPEFAAQINTQDTRNLVERLGSFGCQCGLDHFGRGFYSFGYLRNMKLHYLKIDSSYTRHIDREEDQQFLVRALTDTAHSVDIAVIAQSVETPEERTRLESMHLDGIQGFLTGKPRPMTADVQDPRLTPRSGCG